MTPIRSRVVGRVILERCVQRVEDTGQDREYDKVFADVSHHRRILGVPLMRGATPVGAITIGWDEPGPILDRHEDLLKTFADQAVIAIENVRLFNETKEALEQQTAISEVLRVISGSPTDVKPVLEAVAVRAAKICDASDARVILAEGHSLKHVAGFGDVPMPVEIGGTFPLDRGTVTGRAVIECAPVHVTDMAAEPQDEYPLSHELQKRSGYRTILAVPLMREQRALGGILLRRIEVQPFTEKQIALLKTFADQAAIAIENVRLFNETKEALDQQTATSEILRVIAGLQTDAQPVFDAILSNAVRLTGALYGAVLRPDRSTLSGRAVLTGEVQIVEDVLQDPAYAKNLAHSRRTIAVPMVREGVAFGVVAVAWAEAGPPAPKTVDRSEERRVGKECRSRWSPYH